MGLWLTAVAMLFVLVELFQWMQHFILPLPLYVLGGAFLAIASNSEKGLSFRFDSPATLLNPTDPPLNLPSDREAGAASLPQPDRLPSSPPSPEDGRA